MRRDIYNNKYIKYRLTEKEEKDIEKVWKFIEKFKNIYLNVTEERQRKIKKIRNEYTPEEFYKNEKTANKILWNIREIIHKYEDNKNTNFIVQDKHTQETTKFKEQEFEKKIGIIEKKRYTTRNELKRIVYDKNFLEKKYYRSFINKLIIVNKKEKIVYKKEMEGTIKFLVENEFNLVTTIIFLNRKIYENIIKSILSNSNKEIKEKIDEIKKNKPQFYYQLDYFFPNINYCCYSIGDKNEWIKRIKKYYYKKNDDEWFNIIL